MRLRIALTAAALGASGCGGAAPAPLADGCTASVAGVKRALRRAPRAVVLEDGSLLSRCVSDGLDDGELQTVGITFSRAAEDLALRARDDPAAALQLGYLTGVARKGAARTNGVMAELVRRIEQTAGRVDEAAAPASRAALERGLAAGAQVG